MRNSFLLFKMLFEVYANPTAFSVAKMNSSAQIM